MNALRSRLRPPPHPNFLIFLAFPLLMLIVMGAAWRPLGGGDDVWAHASIGRWIWEHHRIPTRTLFLWTDNVPWIAHAWGTGMWFFALLHLGGPKVGPVLIQVFNVVMSALPFALIWRQYRRRAPFSSLMPPLFVVAIWVSGGRLHPRPELFTALFLVLLYGFLLRWSEDDGARTGPILGLLLMFAIWPNLHGAVAIGLVVLWISAFVELIRTRGDVRLLFLAALCTLIVFTCNPRGFDYLRVFLPIGSRMFSRIDEWKPFWKWPALSVQAVGAEAFLWLLGLILWSRNPDRKWAQLGWMLLMFALFLQARRQLWLLALTSLFVIVTNAPKPDPNAVFRAWRRLIKGDAAQNVPFPMLFIVRVGVLIVLICGVFQAVPQGFWHLGATNKTLPVRLSAFLLKGAPPGRIFNDYENSAYLEWALHGRRSLYIDLNNAYTDGLMDEYFQVLASSKNAQKMAVDEKKRGEILAKRQISVVALRVFTKKEGLSTLAKYLDKQPGWKRIYQGVDGTVWAKRQTASHPQNLQNLRRPRRL